mgnify:CR=1 FL=1
MKRFLLLIFCATLTFTGCDTFFDDSGSGFGEAIFSVSDNNVHFGCDGGDYAINVRTSSHWRATCDASWINLQNTVGYQGVTPLRITVTANSTTASRTGTIKVENSTYNLTKIIKISQDAFSPQLSPSESTIYFSTDEETGSKSTKAFLEKFPDLSAKIVLDNDVGGDICKIITRCKNPVFVKIKSKGLASHGSTPWDGIDANENLFKVWQNIRKIYPSFSLNETFPSNTWIDTVHFAKINGGDVANVIADDAQALLDFRLIETSSLKSLCSNLDKCMIDGVSYEIVSSSTPVVMDENNVYIQKYKQYAESILKSPIEFEYIGGATDSREFAEKGSIIIMHSGSGKGMHTSEEYVDLDSIKQIAKIQIGFLNKFMD